MGFPGGTSGKESACKFRRHGFERAPGEGNGIPLQYSCLENPMDRGAWWAILHRVAKSQTRLKQLSTHTYNLCKLTFHHPETAFQVSMVQVTHLHQPETDSNLPTGIEKDENTYPTLLQDMEQKESSCIHFIKFHVIYIN